MKGWFGLAREQRSAAIVRESPRADVLHIMFGASHGGLERDALATIQSSSTLRHRCIVFGDEGCMGENWERAGATVDFLGSAAGKPFAISRYLNRILSQARPAGVIAWFGLIQLPQIIRECNRHGVPLIVHGGNPAHTLTRLHDLRYLFLSVFYPPSGTLPLYVCCSKYVADSFRRSAYLRKFKTDVVYNGIEMPRSDRTCHVESTSISLFG